MSTTYPILHQAFKEIAYDNGMIFRGKSEEEALAEMWHRVLNHGHTPEQLQEAEQALTKLTREQFETLLCGDQEQAVDPGEVTSTILLHAFEG